MTPAAGRRLRIIGASFAPLAARFLPLAVTFEASPLVAFP
jgi:hypothetical protein